MINFKTIDVNTFLKEYWQKKPLLIRQAIPDFVQPLSADELAGLALEEDVESRMVLETPGKAPNWALRRGPFVESDFAALPKTHWTLLVQGVEKLLPDVATLLDHFDFIPQWRVDDVMVSYAVKHGSVGPHYDHYDVFLYQASGQRKWSLTTKQCNDTNCLKDVDLRIMSQFDVEEEYILSPGDLLYLPPHVGHHGVSLDDDCMTYSFGYRSYQGQELWDSFSDYLSEKTLFTALYRDPNWATIKATSAIPKEAWIQARELMKTMLSDETVLQSWFGSFATRLDQQAEQAMPLPLESDEWGTIDLFTHELKQSKGLLRDATCRMAYDTPDAVRLFINGCEWETEGVSSALLEHIANHRSVDIAGLEPFLSDEKNQRFLYDLWKLQWLVLRDE